MTNRVPHARIVTESVEFRVSNARDKRKNNKSWTKATMQLRGRVMTLSSSPDARLIGRGVFCEWFRNKKKGHLKVVFPDECLYLKFSIESDAAAWMALINEGSTSGGNGGDGHQRKRWVEDYSGGFRPARASDINSTFWILQWVWVPLRDFAGQVVYYDTHKCKYSFTNQLSYVLT